MKVVQWSDEVLRMCSEVTDSPALMGLVRQLSQGSASGRLEMMREAVAMGDFPRAAVLEAEAGTWEGVPQLIEFNAATWRQRTRQ